MAKGVLHIVHPSGEVTQREVPKLSISDLYEVIGCNCVERTKVMYEGRVRDCYLDEEGLLKPGLAMNDKVRELSEAYWKRPCQDFAGIGVIWVPTPRGMK